MDYCKFSTSPPPHMKYPQHHHRQTSLKSKSQISSRCLPTFPTAIFIPKTKLHSSFSSIMSHPFNGETTGEEVCSAFSGQIKDKIFLITGTSANGLGAKCAMTLATHSPRQIILVSRSKSKVEPVINDINSTNPSVIVKFVPCELSDQDSVRKAAETIMHDDSVPEINVIINNAGVMALDKYEVDKHGIELQLSSNHVGHFLLTNLLMPKVLAGGPDARVVNITSHGHRIGPFRFEDPNFRSGTEYDAWSAYGQSKTANVLFTVELARRLGDRGVRAFSVNPGLIMSTGLGAHLDLDKFVPDILAAAEKNNPGIPWTLDGQAKSASQGVSSTLVAALSPELAASSPAYIHDCQVGEPMPYAIDIEKANKLWEYTEDIVGQKFDI